MRGYMGLLLSCSLIITGWIIVIVMLKRHNLVRELPSPNYDWTDPDFAGIMIMYLIFGGLYALHHMFVQWVISSWTNDPVMLARYAGLFKGVLSAGCCVGFGLNAANVSYWNQALFQMIIIFFSLPIIFYLIYTYTTDTNYFIETMAIPPQNIEDVMLAAGLVTERRSMPYWRRSTKQKNRPVFPSLSSRFEGLLLRVCSKRDNDRKLKQPRESLIWYSLVQAL